jgi:hypothetical protein
LFGKTNISLSGDEDIEIDFKSIGFGPVGRRNVALIVMMILTTRVPLLRAFYAR